MIGLNKAALAAVLMLAGCQSYVDAQGRTHLSTGPLNGQVAQAPSDPGHLYMPDSVILEGARSFQSVYRQEGMAGVQTQVVGCRNSVQRGIDRDAYPHCYAFDRAAFMVAVSHDRVHHAAPMPNLDVASFDRRLALYRQALGIPPDVRSQVDDSVFQRVAAVLGSNAP
jgi:hypothetical protein